MKFGIWSVHLIVADFFRLDGGAMFGVVPKVLWSKLMEPDAENRCRFANNVLLIHGELAGKRHIVLVETGNGDKEDERFRERFAIEGSHQLIQNLAAKGVRPEDVTEVIFTHLHFDHAGGGTRRDHSGRIVPTFPKARYFVQKAELEEAQNPSPRTKASYLQYNWEPLLESGCLHAVEGDSEILPMINVRLLPGHNHGNQGVFIGNPGSRLVFPGDLIPTRHHLNPAWCMAYDMNVEVCVQEREKLLNELCGTEDILTFDHDPEHSTGYVRKDGRGRYIFKPIGFPL